jgi:gamma-glutamyltranspeptidase/glutathione hydrolase
LRLPVERQPLEITYRGRRIISLPPPSGGVQVLLALRVLEGLPGSADDEAQWRLALAEATLATFRERERWPDHPADTTPSIANWLVSPERAERLVKSIRPRAVLPVPGTSLGESGNTTHLCAADQEGNVVSLTQSIQSVFGAKTMHPGLGFFYNNYLSTCPRRPHPYRLGPGCLPQSNAAPTLVLSAEGTPLLALGSAGSRRITSSVVQVISAVLDRGVDLGEALAQPRAHALLNRTVWLEESAPDSVQRAFAERFAPVRLRRPLNYKLGAVQALAWDARGNASGAADPRRDGAVAFA